MPSLCSSCLTRLPHPECKGHHLSLCPHPFVGVTAAHWSPTERGDKSLSSSIGFSSNEPRRATTIVTYDFFFHFQALIFAHLGGYSVPPVAICKKVLECMGDAVFFLLYLFFLPHGATSVDLVGLHSSFLPLLNFPLICSLLFPYLSGFRVMTCSHLLGNTQFFLF